MTDKPLTTGFMTASPAGSRPAPARRTPPELKVLAGADVRYDDDPYSWALAQCELLKSGRFDLLDIENLVDEVGDVARREYDELASALEIVLGHLLKWDHQPERRSRSWVLSIAVHREHAQRRLSDNPGLKPRRDQAVVEAYRVARLVAARETKLPRATFPEVCPYSWDEVMGRDISLGDE